MPRDQREVVESPLDQGVREEKVYSFDFSASGVLTIEGNPTFLVLDGDGQDVTATVMPAGGSGTYSGLVATANELKLLTAHQHYMLFCRVPHDGGQLCELFCRILGRP